MVLSGPCRYKNHPQALPAQAQHLTKFTSCLGWRDTLDAPQTPSFLLWSASSNPSHAPHPQVRPGGPASLTSHPLCSLAAANFLHPLPMTRDVGGMQPSSPCETPRSQGEMRGRAWRTWVPACGGQRAAGRQRAVGRAGRAAQEAPAPEVTALLSDPGHIRWLPCLPWRRAPVAPSGCHW